MSEFSEMLLRGQVEAGQRDRLDLARKLDAAEAEIDRLLTLTSEQATEIHVLTQERDNQGVWAKEFRDRLERQATPPSPKGAGRQA